MESITNNVESIEGEAEKILESAKNRANEILLEAREKAKKISSSQLNTDEVKAQSISIVHSAKEEAEKKVEASRLESSKVEAHASDKVDEMVEYILNIVTGAKV